jgi:Flp pilus assembly protein TadG
MSRSFHMQKLFRLVREESGVELVEFAVTAMVLMFILFGVIEFALAMYAYHFTSNAAQQGTRFAMVRGYTWSKNTTTACSTSAPPSFTMPYGCTASSTDIQNYVQSLASAGISPGNVTINTTNSYVWPGTTPDGASTGCTQPNSQGCLVKVTVSYSFKLLPFLKVSALPMSATSETVILQ